MRLWRRDVIAFFGGINETADAMGLTPAAVRNWDRMLSVKLSAQAVGFGVLNRGVEPTSAAFPKWFEAQAA